MIIPIGLLFKCRPKDAGHSEKPPYITKSVGNPTGSGVFLMPFSVLNQGSARGIFRVREEARSMRVVIMMRDKEYRDAFAEMVSETGRDIYAVLNSNTGKVQKEAVILTDVMPHEIDPSALGKLEARTLFLSPVPVSSEIREKYHVIFKYSDITSILAELSSVYADWSGDSGSLAASTRVIAVISESDQLCFERCRTLAAQIIYTHGDSVLLIPMGYVNGQTEKGGTAEKGVFRRMMYMIDEGKDFPPESFTVCDSYGISYIRMPPGINPVSELDDDYILRLIRNAGKHFDTVILDIGTCFRPENLQIISKADNVIFFGSGRNIGDISDFIGEQSAKRVRVFNSADAKDETIEIDDYVREIYGGPVQTDHST